MSAADSFQDRVIQRQVWLLRYANGLSDRFIAILRKSDSALASEMIRRLEKLEGISPSQFIRRRRQIEQIIGQVLNVRDAAFREAQDELIAELTDLASHEAEWTAKAIRTSIPVDGLSLIEVPLERLKTAALSRPFQGNLMKDWARKLSADDRSRLSATIRQGVIEGRTIPELVRSIRGTRANGFTDGILQVTARNANSIARTAVSHVVHSSREEVFKANADIVAGWIWVSTLDGRTTLICMGRDGKVVISPNYTGDIPKGLPLLSPPSAKPPAHWGCRSAMTAMFTFENLKDQSGLRPYVIDTATGKKRQVNFRKEARAAGVPLAEYREKWYAEHVGQVPAGTTYDDWLRKQSAGFQDEVLGPSRARMFRDGTSVDRFTDKSGKTLTLKELQALGL